MHKFFVWGYIKGREYVEYEEIHLFRACVKAANHREAWNLARALAPKECNQISVVSIYESK